MSRIFRRIVSFLLGFVMGISAVAGALVGGAYWAYKNISLKKVGLEQDGFGDVNEITVEEALDLFMKMSENPQNYSIKDFEEKYNFDLEQVLKNFGVELKKETSDEKANVEALKNVNLAYLLSGKGIDMFLDTVSPRVLFNWLPDSILSYGTRARLAQYSLNDLINTDSVTGNLGIIDALATVKLGGLFPSLYTENYDKNVHSYVYTSTDTEKGYLELLGNFNVGSLIASFTDKDTNFLNEFLSGRMTDISQKSVDQLLYELLSSFNTDLAETVRDYAKTLGGKSISDLFIYTEEGNYKFSPENLLKGIKFGYIVGLTEKDGQWYDGDKKADGVKSLIASFSVGSLYDAIQSGKKSGNVSQAILDNLTYQLGDLSIGTFLSEFMGYEQNEQGKWVAPEGKKTLNLLSCLGGISVKGILGGNGTIVENILKTLKDSFKGYRVGDFVSDFVDIEKTENGKWTQNGKELNKLLNGVYDIEINSLIKDKYDLQSVIIVLKDAIGEVAVGDIMGYKCESGKWFDGTEEIDKKIALVCDVKISNVLDIFLSDFSLTSIVKCLTGELTIGDILETYLDFNYDEVTGVYYNSNNKETVPALKKLRNVKLWQLVAPFDKTSSYDLFAVLDQINLGDFLGERNQYDGRWTLTISFLTEELRLNGAFNKVLDINLGKLLDPAVGAEEILEPLKDCTFGEIAQSAMFMSYDEIGGVWESKYINKIYNFMEVLVEIPSTVNDLINVIKGDMEVEPFLKKTLGGVRLGDLIADILDYEYIDYGGTGVWANSNGESYNLYNVLFDYFVIDDTYDIINDFDKLETIKSLTGILEIGDFLAPFTSFSKESGVWTNDGNKTLLVLSDVFSVRISYILSLIQDALNGNKIQVKDVVENVCGRNRSLGDYVKDFLPTDFNYKPLEVLDNLIIYEFLDIVLDGNAKAYGFEDNYAYYTSLFGDLMIGDTFAEFINYTYDTVNGIWQDDTKTDVYKILNAVMSVKFKFIMQIIDKAVNGKEIDISNTVEEVLGYNTIKYYTDDFFNIDNKALDKILGINIPQFVDIVVEGNATEYIGSDGVAYENSVDYLTDVLGDIMVGDTFASFLNYTYDEVTLSWKDGANSDVLRILNAVMSIKFKFILDTVDKAINGGKIDISDTVKEVLGDNTIKYYTDDFFNIDNKALDKILGINIPQFVDIVVEGNATEYIGSDGVAYEDSIAYLKDIVSDLMVGDTFASFLNYTYDEVTLSWKDGANSDVLRILNAVMSIKFKFILDTVDKAINGGKIDISDTVKEVLGDNTIKYYTDDFFNIDNKALDKILGINIPQFVDIVVEGNATEYIGSDGVAYENSVDYLTDVLGDIMVGDTFASFLNYTYDEVTLSWKDGANSDVLRILNAVMSIKFKFILDTVDKAINGGKIDISDTVKEVLGDNTIKYYTDDFFNIDNKALDKILGINIPEFVDIIVEGNAVDHIGSDGAPYEDRVDYLTDVLEGIMVGDTFASYVGYNFDEVSESWKDGIGNDIYRILNDLLKIKFAYVIREVADIINDKADLADLLEGIFGRDTTVGYYVEEFLNESEYEPLKYLYNIGIREFVDVVICGDATDNGYVDVKDYLINKFGEFEVGELFGQFLNLSKGADGDWVKENGQKVKKILEVLLSINVYDTILFITDGDFSGEAISAYVKLNVGENETLGDLLNDLGLEKLDGFRYEYVFKSNGKGIYRVMYEAFKINVVELVKDPANYFTEFFKQYEFMDYIAMYGEFFGNYYDKNDKKWYDGEHEPANNGSMTLMWTTLGLEGTIAFTIAYFCFNDWLVKQCGDKIVYDFIGDAINAVYDESLDVYKFADFTPVSEFWDLLLGTKAGQLCKKGFDFKGYFYESNVLTIGNVAGYYLQKFAFADFELGYDYGLWEVKGDYAQTLSAILNFSLKDFIDSCKAKQAVEYLKDLFSQVQLGDFLTQALGMESSPDGWKKKDSYDYYKNLFRAFFDINIVNTIESIKTNTKNGVFYDEIYGDMFGRDKSVAYYFADFFNQTYNEEKGLWVNANEEVLYSWCQTVYDVNPYTFLHSLRENNLKTALEDTFGVILIGDLTYDLVAKIKFLELKTEKIGDAYVNSGEWIALADTLYNISINDIVENAKKGSFWKEKFCNLYLGDYIASLIKKLLPKMNTESEITYKEDGYEVSGDYYNLLTALFNIYIMDVSDSIKAKNFKAYITGDKALGPVKPVSDIVFNKGTLVYDEINDLWRFNDGEIVPLDFSISSTVKKKIMKLTVNELANNFNYLSLINDLFIGDVMGLSRDAKFKDGANTIYKFADAFYTLNSEGNKVKFPYAIDIDDDGVWYYSDGEFDYPITLEANEWFGTKVFEDYYNVEITTDKNGNVSVTDYDTGKIYPVSYDIINDVYVVTLDAEEACFNVYNGVHFVAEHNGVFRRYKQSELIQRLSNIRVLDLLNGVDLNEIFGDVYVGHLLEYVQGDMSDDPDNQYDYTNTYEKYKWYSDEGKQDRLDALNELVSNICLGSVFDGTLDIYQEGQKLAIKDIVDVETIPVLYSIQDVKIKDMGDAIRALYVGEVMEDEEIDVLVDENGNYLYKSFDSEALYPYYTYAKNASGVYEYAYVNVKQDSGYYYDNGAERVDLQAKKVWAKTNRFTDLRYSVKDGYIYKSGEKVGALTPYGTRENAYVCNMNDSTKFYAISREDAKGNLVYYKAIDETFLESSVTHVENTLLNVVAGIQLKELNKYNFSQTLVNKITGEASIGEFFDREDTGILSLFTQKELNKTSISSFPDAIKNKVTTCGVGQMMDAGLVSISVEKQAKLDAIFSAGGASVEWRNLPVNDFVDQLLDRITV